MGKLVAVTIFKFHTSLMKSEISFVLCEVADAVWLVARIL